MSCSNTSPWPRSVFALVVLLLAAVPVTAQTIIIGPAPSVEFTPSADHAALKLDGSPVVANYQFDAIGMNGAGALAITVGLGKPAPNSAGLIILPVPLLTTITANVVYTATVKAVGPDGEGVSAPSGPFGRAVPRVPLPPGNVKVK